MYHIKFVVILVSALGLAALSGAAASQGSAYKSLSKELNTCALKKKDSKRLKCYDTVAKTLSKGDSITVAKPGTLPENLGGAKFSDKETSQAQSVVGRVTSCQKSHDGRWFYIFEDGQVWKQVDRKKRRYKECKFNVTISKDGIGYKMKIADQKSTVRIRRHK